MKDAKRKDTKDHHNDRLSQQMVFTAMEYLPQKESNKAHFKSDFMKNFSKKYKDMTEGNCDSEYEIEFDEHEYCPHCGQAIKWE